MGESTRLTLAEAFPVGEYIYDEIKARNWSIVGLADKTGLSVDYLSDVFFQQADLTKEAAIAIADATETVAATWLNMQEHYKQWLKAKNP